MNITLKLSGIILLFLGIIITGVVMAKSGRPYSPVLFNVHKFISLAAVVLGGIWVYQLLGNVPHGGLVITLIVLAVVFYVVLFVTGGMLNLDKSYHDILKIAHKVLSPAAIIVTIVLFYLLLKK